MRNQGGKILLHSSTAGHSLREAWLTILSTSRARARASSDGISRTSTSNRTAGGASDGVLQPVLEATLCLDPEALRVTLQNPRRAELRQLLRSHGTEEGGQLLGGPACPRRRENST